MNAFITGSYAYGVPHKDSDIDLVVCLEGGTIDEETLWDHSESNKSCRFGKLNLILLAPDRFAEWKRINDDLLSRGYDVGREEAVAAFQSAGFCAADYTGVQ
jgi:predicted nucleotidyltransferase